MRKHSGTNVHEGHKSRVREDFRVRGLSGLQPHVRMELLLSYAQCRRDTNEIAHRMIKRFGSFMNVFEADYDELICIEGVGERTATFITLVAQIAREIETCPPRLGEIIDNPGQAERFVAKQLRSLRNEHLIVVCLNGQKRVLISKKIASGSANRVETERRIIAELAVKTRAKSIIIGHNHPQGSPLPSQKDTAAAARIKETLSAVAVGFQDFIIVGGDGETYSLAKRGLMP